MFYTGLTKIIVSLKANICIFLEVFKNDVGRYPEPIYLQNWRIFLIHYRLLKFPLKRTINLQHTDNKNRMIQHIHTCLSLDLVL